MKLRDPFGNVYFLKGILVFLFGLTSWYVFTRVQRLKFKGIHHLKELPKSNVLFVSNHQTYFADVTAINHGFHLSRKRWFSSTRSPFYLFPPFVSSYYVAARETMKKGGFLPFLFSLAGAITVRRTWREKGEAVKRTVFPEDQLKIVKAIKSGWVVTFPQGTTKPFSPARKGTAKIIREAEPIVVPVKVEGFRKGFEKKGLMVKKRRTSLIVEFKEPRNYAGLDDQSILLDIMEEIGQANGLHPSLLVES